MDDGSTDSAAQIVAEAAAKAVTPIRCVSVFDRVGGFDPALRTTEDVGWVSSYELFYSLQTCSTYRRRRRALRRRR